MGCGGSSPAAKVIIIHPRGSTHPRVRQHEDGRAPPPPRGSRTAAFTSKLTHASGGTKKGADGVSSPPFWNAAAVGSSSRQRPATFTPAQQWLCAMISSPAGDLHANADD